MVSCGGAGRWPQMRTFRVNRGDEPIQVRVGERFVIEMDGDNLLGQRWSLIPGSRTHVVREEMRGAAGSASARRRFVLEADQAGEEVIVAAQARGGQVDPTLGLWLRVEISE